MEAGRLGTGRLVEALMIPQSTISHQIQRLEKIGYVVRERSADDQRMVTLHLTSRGEEVASACNKVSVEVYQAMVEQLTPARIESARAAMDLMLDSLTRLLRPAD